jgi:hypothetical protein
MAQELMERMSRNSEELGEWRVRAETVIAQAPVPAVRVKTVRRPLAAMLGGAAFFAGVALTAAWTWNIQHVVPSPAQATVGVARVAAIQSIPAPSQQSGLQMSYELAVPPAALAIAQAETGKQ